MREILSYLNNPMKAGVHNLRLTIDFEGVYRYLAQLLQHYEKTKPKNGKTTFPIVSQLSDALSRLNRMEWDEPLLFQELHNAFYVFSRYIEICPDEMRMLFTRPIVMTLSTENNDREPNKWVFKAKYNIFDFNFFLNFKDVAAIRRKFLYPHNWYFDITTIKQKGVKTFIEDLQKIPPIKEKIDIIKERKYHSQRYVFRPYPFAVDLWLSDISSEILQVDLKSFLQGSTRYIKSKEWRTSIVLSAIAVESMLADLYEENYHTPAPDEPFGSLYVKVQDKVKFPTEIMSAIKRTNEARIAAVHRSRLSVSEREAINALFGATNFALWYSKQ